MCELGRHGASVTHVAQRHDLRRQRIYAWRHDLRKRGLCEAEGVARFLPVGFGPPPVSVYNVAAESSVPTVEILLRNSRQIRCQGRIGDDDLARLIRLVEAA